MPLRTPFFGLPTAAPVGGVSASAQVNGAVRAGFVVRGGGST